MYGGVGNDTYYADVAGDNAIEALGAGIDLVLATVSYSLAARPNVENLALLGAALDGTGNELANAILGNAGANSLTGDGGDDVLDGGLGDDTMAGGQGHDHYYVRDADDEVQENANQGTDHVHAAVSYELSANVEFLSLDLTQDAIDGTGNDLADHIYGNDNENLLRGVDGSDYLYGQGGEDTLDGGLGQDVLDGGLGADSSAGEDSATIASSSTMPATGSKAEAAPTASTPRSTSPSVSPRKCCT